MTSLDRPAVSRGSAAVGPPPADSSEHGKPSKPAVPLWMRLLPPVFTLAVMLWGIRVPSYSQDEAATLSAVQRPFGQMIHLLQSDDAFHGAYYMLIWPLVRLAGPDPLVTRLPSALAMAVAAAFTAAIGWRLISPRAGLMAGLVLAVLPEVSVFGQTARPYALATALAAVASYLLVRAMQASAAGERIDGWLVAYGASVVVLGYLHPFAVLLLVAHAIPVARQLLRRSGRSLALGWLAAGVLVALFVAPLILVTRRQTTGASLAWANNPALSQIRGLVSLVGPLPMAFAAAAVLLVAVAVSAFAGRTRLRANLPADLFALCIPWMLVPPAILIAAAQVTPVYTFRYVIFCTPAVALLVGAALAAVDWRLGIAGLVVIAALGYHVQARDRSATGHGNNLRAADQIVARYMRPGDVSFYVTLRQAIGSAYPYGIGKLKNVEVGERPIPSGTFGGKFAGLRTVRLRLDKASRVWLIQLTPHSTPVPPPEILARHHFIRTRVWYEDKVWVILYVHHNPPAHHRRH